MSDVKRYKLRAGMPDTAVLFLPDEVVSAADFDALRAELAALKAPAPAQDEREAKAWPALAGIGRDSGHPRAVVLYLRHEPSDEHLRMIQEALRTRPAQTEQQQPCGYQYQAPDGNWFPLAKSMLAGAEEHGHKVRAIYAAPIAQPPADGPNYKFKFEALVEHAKRQDKVIADMRYDENIRRYYDTGEVWFWAGDGTDNLDTLACHVVINAGDLRALIAGKPADGLVEALEHARLFIRNGVELGYIQMPDVDTPDPAHDTLPKIEAALAAHRAGGA